MQCVEVEKKAKLIFGASLVVHNLNNISKIPQAGTPQEKEGKREKPILKTIRLRETVIDTKITPNVISSMLNEFEK